MPLLVLESDPGVLEIAFTWLPTFMGMDIALMKEATALVLDRLKGREIDEALLEEAHEALVVFLCTRYPLEGLHPFLQAVKAVRT